jgi:O-antigen/teichoic acid export membrane protein
MSYVAYLVINSADTLILGRLLGPAELGLYTVAMNFAGMPLSKIGPIINAVAFPAFAMVQHAPVEARFYAMKATRLMATAAVPVFFGISAVAPEIVDLVFGQRWGAARPILAVLALAMPFRAILLVVPNYLIGIGNARANFCCSAIGVMLFPPAFLIGSHWGVSGVCYAWLIGYPIMYSLTAMIASRFGHLDFRALLATPLRPLAAGIVMLAVVTTFRTYLLPDSPATVRAAVLVAAGAVTYGAVMVLAFRPLVREMLSLVYRRRETVA